MSIYINKIGFAEDIYAVERIAKDNYVCHHTTGGVTKAYWRDSDLVTMQYIEQVSSLSEAGARWIAIKEQGAPA